MRDSIFWILWITAGAAAQGQSPPQTVTVEQAVEEAVGRNLNLLAERYNLSVADARIITARLRPNPVFSAGWDYLDWLGTGFNTRNAAGPTEVNFRTDFLLERGGKRRARMDLAENARSVAQLQLLNTTRSLVLDVQSAFIDVLLAKENLELARNNLSVFEGIVKVNSARVQAGDLAQVELVRSRVAALQARNAVRQAELRLTVARNRLQTLLGRTPLSDAFDAAGPLRREAGPLSSDELKELALKLRPDLQALQRDQARSQADIRLQLAQGKVDYTVGAMYHRQYDNAKGNALGVFFSAPLPIFNRNQGEIERANQEQRQILARIRAAEHGIGAEVENAFRQYQTAKSLLENIERDMLGQAKEVRETTEYSYRRGEASFVELLDAQRAFNDTIQGYNEARAEYSRSLYTMDAISGKGVSP